MFSVKTFKTNHFTENTTHYFGVMSQYPIFYRKYHPINSYFSAKLSRLDTFTENTCAFFGKKRNNQHSHRKRCFRFRWILQKSDIPPNAYK